MTKYLVVITTLFIISCASTKETPVDTTKVHWLEPVPEGVLSYEIEFPKAKIFEVPASKLGTAEYWLKDALYLPGNSGTVKYFGQPDFECPALNKAYLLRANYLNGGTGHFDVSIKDRIVIVGHFSLGGGTIMHQSALVACLPVEPTHVFSDVSSAL